MSDGPPSASHDEFPAGYHARISHVERDHWWYRGMRDLSAVLLEPWLARGEQSLLDAGCGTGGFLRWALDTGALRTACGVDLAPAAVELARAEAPEADVRLGSIITLPYADQSFDIVVCNDVVQHIARDDAVRALAELARVTRPGGAVLVRTRGSRRPGPSYHAYDRELLALTLERAGLTPRKVIFANLGGSVLAALRRRTPRVLERERGEGIPRPVSWLKAAVASRLMAIERELLLRRAPVEVPWGHTIMALAVAPPAGGDTSSGRRTETPGSDVLSA